jgi:hypothetical protein
MVIGMFDIMNDPRFNNVQLICHAGYLAIIHGLIANGIRISPNDIMSTGCGHGWDDYILWAISEGATDFDNGLIQAVQHQQLDAARMMIAHGATNPHSCISVACRTGNVELVKLLADTNTRWFDPILRAIQCQQLEWIPGNVYSDCWDSGLIEACCFGNISVAKLMIDYGADAYIGIYNACRYGFYDIADSLIAYSPMNVNQMLNRACCCHHSDMMMFSIKHGACILNKNFRGSWARDYSKYISQVDFKDSIARAKKCPCGISFKRHLVRYKTVITEE